jgi:cytosine/adenosine deaminase-related metal-dependent hydrolase
MTTTAIVGARVLTMDEQRREISAATALIEDYEIAVLGPSADVVVPGGVRIVDGRGKAMIPVLLAGARVAATRSWRRSGR